MTFDWLNTAYTYDMYLEQGDSMEVLLEKERGKVSVFIQSKDEEPVYQGDDMEPSSFAVNIKETRNYCNDNVTCVKCVWNGNNRKQNKKIFECWTKSPGDSAAVRFAMKNHMDT